MYQMEVEKAGSFSCKVAYSSVNGRGNKFKLLTLETEFNKQSVMSTNVIGRRIQIPQNYS
jgi:hypothetical protein